MLSEKLIKNINYRFRIKRILWLALTAGIIIYFIAVYFITRNTEPTPNFSNIIGYIILATGSLLTLFSITLKKYLCRSNNIHDFLISKSLGDRHKEISQNRNSANDQDNNQYNYEDKIMDYLSRNQVYYIINLALNDSIAILGLATGFMSKDISQCLPYIIVAILLNVWMYPGDKNLIEKIKKLHLQFN